MGRENQYPLTKELESNLRQLLVHLNQFRTYYAIPMQVSSGYRPGSFNSSLTNAAKKSNHMVCLACDFKDTDGKLAKFCLENTHILELFSLYLENPASTVGWVHLQITSPKSGSRVFNP